MKFEELNLLEVGHSIGLVGAVFSGNNEMYLCMFPRSHCNIHDDEVRAPGKRMWDWHPDGSHGVMNTEKSTRIVAIDSCPSCPSCPFVRNESGIPSECSISGERARSHLLPLRCPLKTEQVLVRLSHKENTGT